MYKTATNLIVAWMSKGIILNFDSCYVVSLGEDNYYMECKLLEQVIKVFQFYYLAILTTTVTVPSCHKIWRGGGGGGKNCIISVLCSHNCLHN